MTCGAIVVVPIMCSAVRHARVSPHSTPPVTCATAHKQLATHGVWAKVLLPPKQWKTEPNRAARPDPHADIDNYVTLLNTFVGLACYCCCCSNPHRSHCGSIRPHQDSTLTSSPACQHRPPVFLSSSLEDVHGGRRSTRHRRSSDGVVSRHWQGDSGYPRGARMHRVCDGPICGRHHNATGECSGCVYACNSDADRNRTARRITRILSRRFSSFPEFRLLVTGGRFWCRFFVYGIRLRR